MLLFTAISVSVNTAAQQRFTVADMTTHAPLRGVNILINNAIEIQSRWNGSFMIDSTAAILTLQHPRYETLGTKRCEIVDTVFLLPDARHLKEVVVTGKKPRLKMSFKISETDRMNDDLNALAKKEGADLLPTLTKIFKKIFYKDGLSSKERRRMEHQKMLDDY